MMKSLTDGGQTTVNWVFNYIVYVSNPVCVRRLERYAPRPLLFFFLPIVVHNFTATALQSLDTCTAHLFKITLEESFQHTAIRSIMPETQG